MCTLYDRIVFLCEEKGIRPGRLCDELGYSRSTLGDLKAGRTKSLTSSKLSEIAAYFGVSTDYLIANQPPLFSSRLKELRKEHHLSQAQFAKEFNVASGTIGMWETGKRQPDLDTTKRIADFFGVTIDYLLGNEDVSAQEKAAPETGGGLTPDQRYFMENVWKLTPDQMAFLAAQIKVLLEGQK